MLNSLEILCRSVKERHISNKFITSRIKAFEKEIKKEAAKGNEAKANNLWILKYIFKVQNHYLEAFNLIKKHKFYKAWCELEHCEIALSSLLNHILPMKQDDYYIDFINKQVKSWQELYPYKMFISPEILEKQLKCSICREILSPTSYCQHKVGNLYSGKLCHIIVSKLDILGLSLVENPVQKYSVPFIKNEETGKDVDHYDYSLLEFVAKRLDSPFEQWQSKWGTKLHKRDDFEHLSGDDNCPCNSGEKFKDCCYNKDSLLMPHLEAVFDKDLPQNLLNDELVL